MKAPVTMNHGRWIVECVKPTCSNAYQVEPGAKRVRCECKSGGMVCVHANPCGARLDLVWPRQRAAIERATAHRPTANRNWEPGETVPQLRAENVAHGLPEVAS